MALISVNGSALPTPSDYSVGVQDLSKADRNASGFMIIERIATKIKLEVKYNYLTGPDLQTILSKISGTFFDVTYLDPVSNNYKTTSMYCGDRTAGMIDFFNGVPRYKELSFSLIER